MPKITENLFDKNFLARRVRNIKDSFMTTIKQKIESLKEQGQKIISLDIGEPDFNTLDNIKKAGINAIEENFTKYTNLTGILPLKKAIQQKFMRDNNLKFEIDQIIVSSGAKHAIFNCFLASLNEGDEVLIPSPYWGSYPSSVLLAGGIPKYIQCSIHNGFKLTKSDLEQAITPKTKWLILNSPNNPTGAVYNEKELEDIVAVMNQHQHIHVLCDDIYEHIIFGGKKFTTLLEVANRINPNLKNRILIVNGVSKSYAMTGWRIGYAAGARELIKAMGTVQSHTTANPVSISQVAAVEALLGPQDFLKEYPKICEEKSSILSSILDKDGLLKTFPPSGTFYAFVSMEKLIGKRYGHINNSVDFTEYLLSEAKVSVIPGSVFGLDGYFRVSYAIDKESLIKACDNIANACIKLQ